MGHRKSERGHLLVSGFGKTREVVDIWRLLGVRVSPRQEGGYLQIFALAHLIVKRGFPAEIWELSVLIAEHEPNVGLELTALRRIAVQGGAAPPLAEGQLVRLARLWAVAH